MSMPNLSFNWQESARGIHRRLLYGEEIGLASAASHDGFTGIFVALTIALSDKVSALGDLESLLIPAWTAVRCKHPQIAVQLLKVPYGGRNSDKHVEHAWIAEYRSYTYPNVNASDIYRCWLTESMKLHSACSQAQLFDKVRSSEVKLVTGSASNYAVHLHFAPDPLHSHFHAVVSAQHALFDARAVFMVLNAFLSSLVEARQIPPSETAQRLPPPLPFALGLRQADDKVQGSDIQAALDAERSLAEVSKHRAFLPTKISENSASDLNGLVKVRIPVLPLLEASRRHHTSVSAVLLVSYALATLEHAANAEEANCVRIDLTVDVRALLKALAPDQATIAATTFANVLLQADALRTIMRHLKSSDIMPELFWELCAQAKRAFTDAPRDLSLIKHSHEMSQEDRPWLSFPPILWPSFLGRLDDFLPSTCAGSHRSVTVSDPFVTVKNGPGSIISHVWSWNNELTIVHNYARQSFGIAQVEDLAKSVTANLRAAAS